MKKSKNRRLKLNKVNISKIQNASLLLGGFSAKPSKLDLTKRTLGAGEVTDSDG